KFNHWELKGVPLRIEVGPRDVEAGQVVLVDRLTREKRPVPAAGLAQRLVDEVEACQKAIWERALSFQREQTFEVSTLEEMVEHFRDRAGFVYAPWCGSEECETRIKDATGGATTRNYDPDEAASGRCISCGEKAEHRVAFAKSY
ncbi:MAG TPA: His/Gly/Thr/Pro-type tRNA ligase C-terminal domain-containing protein, partial [Candidatus Dormibacteraeota bacterium]|nr:His/Gly/Thr/Pro-type tRNA ligase C-terminal domain-containing protein [Candidatus Dormibacteraeota bacterium]